MAELTRVAGIGFDGSSVSTTIGKVPIQLIKASYGDSLETQWVQLMGQQTQGEQSMGSYKTTELSITMTAFVFRTVFLPAMPQNGGGNIYLPLVIGRSHPQLGDDSDLLDACRILNLSAAVENSAKVEEIELKGSITQIYWGDSRKTLNYIVRTNEVPAGAQASGF